MSLTPRLIEHARRNDAGPEGLAATARQAGFRSRRLY